MVLEAAVVAVAPFVPVAVARSLDEPAVKPVKCSVTVLPDTVTSAGVSAEPHTVPPLVDTWPVYSHGSPVPVGTGKASVAIPVAPAVPVGAPAAKTGTPPSAVQPG